MVTLQQFLAQRDGSQHGRVKVALVVQGGGMRGVYSMGALRALENANLTSSFDVVLGSSAGAINGAYLLSGQAQDAVEVYVEYLSNRKFVDFVRFWKAVDIDYLVDVALKTKCPLNILNLRASPCLLEVIVTNAETGFPQVFTNRDKIDFYEVIRATAAMPGLYNKRIPLAGEHFVDGALADSLPVVRAVREQAILVVVVLTQNPDFKKAPMPYAKSLAIRLALRGQSRAVRALVGPDNEPYNEAIRMLENRPINDSVTLVSVTPSDTRLLVQRTTRDRRRLRACAEMGDRDMRAALSTALPEMSCFS
jgi:predicted patatin/cPLA2 family phospholipase